MQAGELILFPGAERILLERLALFLALDVLRNGFSHDPVRCAPADFGQVLDAPFQLVIELDGCCRCHVASVAKGNTSWYYSPLLPCRPPRGGRAEIVLKAHLDG